MLKSKCAINCFAAIAIAVLLSSFALAGVGIKWSQESAIVNEGEKACLSYSVYNPWPEDSFVAIGVSDELKNILVAQESEAKLIVANTNSTEAIPVQFCFKVPQVYKRDFLLGDSLICKQDCNEEQKVYSGEILVSSVPQPKTMGGSGGSSTSMAVSAPLKIKVACNAHKRDFSLVYWAIAVIALIVIACIIYKRTRKPAIQRYKEEMKELKEKIKKAKQ